MSLHHKPKTWRSYRRQRGADRKATDACPFCDIGTREPVVEEGKTMLVIRNRTKYDYFEGVPVEQHLMVIPRAHRTSLSEFTDEEVLEQARVTGRYEKLGYHVFARGMGTKTRSVAHQHTHLIKITTKLPKLFVVVDNVGVVIAQ